MLRHPLHLTVSLLPLALAALLLAACAHEPVEPTVEQVAPTVTRFTYAEQHMGTTFNIVLYAADEATADAAAAAAFARIDALNSKLSDYDAESELSRLSASSGTGTTVPVSDELYYMLRRSKEFSHASDGAFDITVGPVVRHWRRARRQRERPHDDRLAEAQAAVGYHYIELDDTAQTATLTVPNMRLDLGGIGKGYATAEALKTLQSHGIEQALVDGGGDIALGAAPPDRTGWRVAVVQPIANAEDDATPRYLIGENLAVATSGDVFQFVEIEGVRYSHIIDPRTGEPTTTPMAITVIADNATDADALASAIGVLGPEAGIALAESYNAAAIVTSLNDEGHAIRHESNNLDRFRIVDEDHLADQPG